MSPLERAARALCELDNNPPGATMDGKPLWMDYLPEVRAVVAALREPDQAIADKLTESARGMEQFFQREKLPTEDKDRCVALGVQAAFIDALLAESVK